MPEDALAEREATRVGTRAPPQGMASSDRDAEQARATEEGRADEIDEFNDTGHTGNHPGLEQINEQHVDDHLTGQTGPAWGTLVSSGTQPAPPSLVGFLCASGLCNVWHDLVTHTLLKPDSRSRSSTCHKFSLMRTA